MNQSESFISSCIVHYARVCAPHLTQSINVSYKSDAIFHTDILFLHFVIKKWHSLFLPQQSYQSIVPRISSILVLSRTKSHILSVHAFLYYSRTIQVHPENKIIDIKNGVLIYLHIFKTHK